MGEDEDFDRLMGVLIDTLEEKTEKQEYRLQLPSVIDVVAIRKRVSLSQAAFSARIGVPVATLRNWEQGHRKPQGPARVLLALLNRNPRIVEEILGR
jgi:putative transcriptional regulator